MKKSVIAFFVFLVCGFIVWEILGSVDAGKHFKYYFPLVIFVEIAAYGSLILCEVSKSVLKMINVERMMINDSFAFGCLNCAEFWKSS